MSDVQLKKMGSLQQQIAKLKNEQQQIEKILGEEVINTLQQKDAFLLHFDTLIGGILEVIASISQHTTAGATDVSMEGWRQAGQKFRRTIRKAPNRSKALSAATA